MKTNAAVALLALTLPVILMAQPRWHDDDTDRHRRGRPVPSVTFYEHANFRGDSITIFVGEAISNLDGKRFEGGRRINDRISSVRVEGGAEALVFLDSRYRGEVMRITRDVRDLAQVGVTGRATTWNDLISSIRVEFREPSPGHNRPGNGRPDHNRPPARPSIDVEKIINRSYQDVLRRDVDATGLRTFRSRIIEEGWTEQMVRDALRKSEEYRTVTVVNIVRRAYADLLGRDADGGGERHYVYQLLNRGWSEEDVRNDIRKSAEYRNRQRQLDEQARAEAKAAKAADRDRGAEREAR